MNANTIQDIYALSPVQQGMLFHSVYAPSSGVYCVQLVYRLRGALNLAAFEQAWQQVVTQHTALRTGFHWEGLEHPVQVVHQAVPVSLVQEDWRDQNCQEQRSRLKEFLNGDRQQGFDLESPPLMRLTLIRLADELYHFIWSKHHLILDGWSTAIVLQEVVEQYQSLCAGTSLTATGGSTFGHYISWWQQQDLSKAETFWRQTLKGISAPTPLLRPFKNDISASPASKEQLLTLNSSTTAALLTFAQDSQLTLNTVVQGAWALLLGHYSGEKDVLYGATVAGRPPDLSRAEATVGLFINTLPVRVNLPTEQSLLPWLQHLQDQLAQLRQYEYTSLVDVQGWSEIPRGIPLFESIVVFENYPVNQVLKKQQFGFEIEEAWAVEQTNYPLTLTVIPGTELTLKLTYNCQRFEELTIVRILNHLQTLLTGMVRHSTAQLFDLPLLSVAETEQLLLEWNATESPYPLVSLPQLFEAQVARTPNAVAAVFENGASLQYQELNAKANQLAHTLRQQGVKAGVLVGICVERSLKMLIGLLGILKAGGAYVPLDSAYPRKRLAFMLADSQVSVLVTQENLLPTLPEHFAKVVCLDSSLNTQTENLQDAPSLDDVAYVIYTSGSTGKPKGVQVSHRAVVNLLSAMQTSPGLSADDTLLSVTTLSFDIAALELYLPLLVGAKVMIVSREVATDGTRLLPYLEQATVMQATPATWQMLLAAGWQGNTLKILSGGEALPRQLANHLLERATEVWNLYGPTETTIWSAIHRVIPGTGVVPIGRPIANTEFYVLNEQQRPVPVGASGELHIGGVGLAVGYLNREQLTAEKFIPHPFKASRRLYKTGDLVRYHSDGTLEYLGRQDDQVKLRGFRMELGEIEAALTEHCAVQEGVVIVRDADSENAQLVAYIILAPESTVSVTEIRQFLSQKLPSVMIPGAFVVLEAFPLTPNGKVNRRSLQQNPQFAPQQQHTPERLPRTPIEEKVAEIWQEILRINSLSIDDNFFELGGHSLIATRILAQLREHFEIDLPLRALFEAPTVEGLAQAIETMLGTPAQFKLPPIVPISRAESLPLSLAQQRLWFLTQFDPDSPQYHIAKVVRLEGSLHLNALEQSFQALLQRHEILCTAFSTVNGKPRVSIASSVPFLLAVTDLEALSPTEQQERIEQEAIAQAQQPFYLHLPPLFRAKLLRLSATEHILLLTLHHLIADGWSMDVLVREITQSYRAYSQGTPSSLPALPIQYIDFAAWQHQYLTTAVLETQLNYWRKQLQDAPTLLELPTDYPRPAVNTFRGATYSLTLSPTLTQSLKTLSQNTDATLFMTLLAGFVTLLSRYSGTEDIVVGSPIANRHVREIEQLIGFFVNTLVLRTDLSGNPTFKELLERVKEVALGAYAHQDLPFEQLVEALQPQRDLSYTPLFQVMFILQNTPMSAVELPELTVTTLDNSGRTAKFDLTLSMVETETGLIAAFEYNTDLFAPETIARLAAHFQTLLAGICANPQQPIAQLPLLCAAEQQQLLVEWNNTQTNLPDKHLHRLVEEQVQRTPDAVAVTFADSHLTYTQLNQRANQLAHYLPQLGVKPGDLVGICVSRSPEMLIGILGILKAGCAYIPLDAAYPQERLALMLEDAKVSVLVTQSSQIPHLPPTTAQLIDLETDQHKISPQPTSNPLIPLAGDALAYIIYTSGSTGKPKGVQIYHRAVVNFLSSMQQSPGITEGDSLVAVTTLSFDIAVLELFLPLTVGAQVIIASREVATDGTQLAQLLERLQPTIMQATPATWRMLLAAGWSGSPTLKVLCGGEALPQELAVQLLSRVNSLWNVYGPTETTIWSAVYPVEVLPNMPTVPIGHPIANTEFYVLDHHQQPVPIGVPGELYIGGAGLAQGYLHRPELTSEKFIPHPFKPQERLYRTGDQVKYLADGTLAFLGRLDNQVKIRGFRVEVGEIEAVLAQHPAVQEAVVFVPQSESSDRQLVGYILGKNITSGELRSFLLKQLPHYMIPSTFVILDHFPLTPNGKVNRQALPIPNGDACKPSETFVAPRSLPEKRLADIWANVLGVTRVGIHDNFFALGGDSIRSIQVRAQAQAQGMSFSVQQLFQHQTIAELAQVLTTGEETPETVAAFSLITNHDRTQIPPEVEDAYPLTPLQLGMLFHNVYNQNSSAFHNVLSFHLQFPLHPQALHIAIQQLLQRHPVLRTGFDLTHFEEPLQLVYGEVNVPLNVEDLRSHALSEQNTVISQAIETEKQRRLDWQHPPLLKFQVHQRSAETFQLTLSFHHAILDGWSIASLLTELFDNYFATLNQETLAVKPLPKVQFRNFVAQQIQALTSPESRQYWQQTLAGTPRTILTDITTPSTHISSALSVPIPDTTFTQLNQLAQRASVPLKSVLLTAHLYLLRVLTRQTDVLTGLSSNGRPETEDGDRILGLFLNTLPLRVQLPEGGTWRDLIAATFTAEQAALPHRWYPLAQIQKDLGGQPLFNVSFNFTHFHIYQSLQKFSQLKVLNTHYFEMTDLALLTHFTLSANTSGLQLLLKYNPLILTPEKVQAIADCYNLILQHLITHSEQPYADFNVVLEQKLAASATQKAQILEQVSIQKLKLTRRRKVNPN